MSNGEWEKRITVLERQNDSICQKIKELRGTVKEIRDNHLVHLRRQIASLQLDIERNRREIAEDIAELSANLVATDAELDKRLTAMTVKMGAIMAAITTIVNFIVNFIMDKAL